MRFVASFLTIRGLFSKPITMVAQVGFSGQMLLMVITSEPAEVDSQTH